MQLMNKDKELEDLMVSQKWEDREFYGSYLAQTYYFVYHSTKLLGLAYARMFKQDEAFESRFLEHLKEEQNHDLVALKDLKNLGFNLEDFEESSFTKSFWQTQYYYVQNEDPLILLGYILFLEEAAVDIVPSILDRVRNAHPKSFTFLKIHGEEDPLHVEKARIAINSLDKERQAKIWINYKQSYETFMALMNECSEQSYKTKIAG